MGGFGVFFFIFLPWLFGIYLIHCILQMHLTTTRELFLILLSNFFFPFFTEDIWKHLTSPRRMILTLVKQLANIYSRKEFIPNFKQCIKTFSLCLYLILGIPVNYKDVESIDPVYSKNLQVCLSSLPTDNFNERVLSILPRFFQDFTFKERLESFVELCI